MAKGLTIKLYGQSDRDRAHRLVDRAPPRSELTFAEEVRSPDQNSLMWVLLGQIALAKPEGRVMPTEHWKSLFMAQAGHTPIWEPALDGNGVVCVGYKSSRLRKAEFGDLINGIYEYGARHGVRFSDELETSA